MTIEETLRDLEAAQKDGDRPVTVKVPSCASSSQHCSSCQRAMQYLKQNAMRLSNVDVSFTGTPKMLYLKHLHQCNLAADMDCTPSELQIMTNETIKLVARLVDRPNSVRVASEIEDGIHDAVNQIVQSATSQSSCSAKPSHGGAPNMNESNPAASDVIYMCGRRA